METQRRPAAYDGKRNGESLGDDGYVERAADPDERGAEAGALGEQLPLTQ